MNLRTATLRLIVGLANIAVVLLVNGSVTDADHAHPVAAVTFNVTKTADTNDGLCDTDCSLREAVVAANATVGPDTIIVPGGTYTLTIAGTGENAAATGDLDITDDLILIGAGAATTIIDGGAVDRVFQILGNVPVTLSGVTVRNGYLGTTDGAGGVRNSGILTVTACTIAQNQASYGGGIANFGTLALISTTVSHNRALNGAGGGIYTASNTVTLIKNTTVYSNTSGGAGGGISIGFINGALLTMANTTVSQNSGDYGGGVAVFGNTTTINNSTIVNNSDLSDAGGLDLIGGAILIRNSVVAQNRSSAGAPDCNGPLSSQGYNLIGSTTGCVLTATTGDLTNRAARLGPLQDNGGPTLTHALLPGSPAIDAGNPAAPGTGEMACEPVDQRGVARPQNELCDSGAFEAVLWRVFLPGLIKQ